MGSMKWCHELEFVGLGFSSSSVRVVASQSGSWEQQMCVAPQALARFCEWGEMDHMWLDDLENVIIGNKGVKRR